MNKHAFDRWTKVEKRNTEIHTLAIRYARQDGEAGKLARDILKILAGVAESVTSLNCADNSNCEDIPLGGDFPLL